MIEKIDRALGQMVRENDSIALAAEVAHLRADNRALRDAITAEIARLRADNQALRDGVRVIVGEAQVEKNLLYAEVARLRDALHIAISAPMGVVPDAALEWYDPERYPTRSARMHADYREAELAAARTAASAALDPAAAGENGDARHLDDWDEGVGPALWWRFPINEPPYAGTPLDSDWPGYHTHWTPITVPDAALAAEWCSCGDRLAAGELECWICASVDRAAPAMEVES